MRINLQKISTAAATHAAGSGKSPPGIWARIRSAVIFDFFAGFIAGLAFCFVIWLLMRIKRRFAAKKKAAATKSLYSTKQLTNQL